MIRINRHYLMSEWTLWWKVQTFEQMRRNDKHGMHTETWCLTEDGAGTQVRDNQEQVNDQVKVIKVIYKCQSLNYRCWLSDTALLQILSWYGSESVRGEEARREGHGRERGGQTGRDRDGGRTGRQWAITCLAYVYGAGVSRGMKKHRGSVHGVSG